MADTGGEETAASVAACRAALCWPAWPLTRIPSALEERREGAGRLRGRVGGPGPEVAGVVRVLRGAARGQPALVDLQRGDRGDVAGGDVGLRPSRRQRRPAVQRGVVADPGRPAALGAQRPGGGGGQLLERGRLRVVRRGHGARGQGRITAADQDDRSGRGARHHRVRSRAEGPRTSSAAAAVTSLVVDAGWSRSEAPRANSTRPVPGSMTSAPACLPSTPEPSTPDSAADRPRLVGMGAEGRAPASTRLAAAAGRAATRGMFHRASRAGIRTPRPRRPRA